jgi:hypothetical protein
MVPRKQPRATRMGVAKCRSCGADIRFAVMLDGVGVPRRKDDGSARSHPFDLMPVDGGHWKLELGLVDGKPTMVAQNVGRVRGAYGHRSHYSSCPDAPAWRPKRGSR